MIATLSGRRATDWSKKKPRLRRRLTSIMGIVLVLEQDDDSSNRHPALAFWWSMIFEPHPCGETRKLGTSCWDRRQEPVRRGPGRQQVCFKFGRRSIGERRVQAAAVVDVFEEGADRRARVVYVAVGCSVDLLLLERAHEALRLGIVGGTANAAHARPDVV